MKISIFKDVYSNGSNVELDYVLERIRTGGDFSKTIEKIRASTSEEEQQRLKKTLPGVTFCGTFRSRRIQDLIEASGLVILDFDTPWVVLEESPFFYATWRSPRGGMKALVKIPVVKSDQEFKQYFYALQARFPDVDPSGKDISRFCFMSHDPDIHINPESQVWTETVKTERSPGKSVKSDFKRLNTAIAMIDKAEVGNRNNTMIKAGKLIGGYIASGELNEIDALEICGRAIQAMDPADYKDNFRSFRNGIEYGKQEPLSDGERKNIEDETKIGKIHYEIEEAQSDLDRMYADGFVRGFETGWRKFDEYYTMRLGYTTYIYGAPFTGKTVWWFNVLVQLSRRYGLRHLIYSPETGDKNDVYSLLIQIAGGGDITATYKNRMPPEKYEEAKKFIGKHFIVISTDETDTELSPDDLLDYVDVVEGKYGRIDTVTIDPWNELEHMEESARDLYLNRVLKRVRVNARKRNRHICIITHIRDQKPIGCDEHGTMIYPFPTAHDVAGGQVWYRKGFMMLAMYRHFVPDGVEEVKLSKYKTFRSTQLDIRVQKYKPEGSGKRGEIEFTYFPHLHQYSCNNQMASFAVDHAKAEPIPSTQSDFIF